MKRWRKVVCSSCVLGVVGDYRNGDFYGPKECNTCGGSGYNWISPKGAIAMWPGGPFVGTMTKKELAEARGTAQEA